MVEEVDYNQVIENQKIVADNQYVMDQKMSKIEQALSKALDQLTPKEQRELEEKKKTPTIEDVEKILDRKEQEKKQERAAQEQFNHLKKAAEDRMDVVEDSIKEFLEKNEIDFDEDAEELFDTWSKKMVDKGLEEQKTNGGNFDWKKYQERMEAKFAKNFRLNLDKSEDEEEEKPKRRETKPLTGLNDSVSFKSEKGDKYDKLMDKLSAHNKGTTKMSLDELISVHSQLNRAKNKRGMAEAI